MRKLRRTSASWGTSLGSAHWLFAHRACRLCSPPGVDLYRRLPQRSQGGWRSVSMPMITPPITVDFGYISLHELSQWRPGSSVSRHLESGVVDLLCNALGPHACGLDPEDGEEYAADDQERRIGQDMQQDLVAGNRREAQLRHSRSGRTRYQARYPIAWPVNGREVDTSSPETG